MCRSSIRCRCTLGGQVVVNASTHEQSQTRWSIDLAHCLSDLPILPRHAYAVQAATAKAAAGHAGGGA